MDRRRINLLSGHDVTDEKSSAVARANLCHLLDRWAGMDEATHSADQVETDCRNILNVFLTHEEAEEWFRIWRAQNPGARLC